MALHSAGAVTLEWDPSPDIWVTGYAVHYGTSSGGYTVRVDVGNQMTATITNLSPGVTYYFVATAYTTNDLESLPSNEVSYTVPNGTFNQPPQVVAGPDGSVTLPNAITLSGAVTDDGLPNPPGVTSASWSKVSGPGTVTFQSPSSPTTTASFSSAGTYVLRLTATDSALTASDDVTVTVSPAPPVNQPPQVAAGPDRLVTLPDAVGLSGAVTDDGLPNPPGVTSATWSQVSGPGTVTFQNPSSPNTTASFSSAGTYVLRLTATDSALSASDDVTMTVSPSPPVNQPPQVAAGPDRSVTLPNTAALSGAVTDDGLPNPPGITSATWSKVSGPGTVTFQNSSSPTTTASFSSAGTYVLRLRATDSALTASDDVTVTVSPTPQPNQPPIVEAGGHRSVVLPTAILLRGSAADDGLPANPGRVTATWSVVSGPGPVVFQNANATNTAATFTIAGNYVLRLTATDGELTVFDDVTATATVASAPNQAPLVEAGGHRTVVLPSPVILRGSASDDGQPAPPAQVTVTWSVVSGPGPVVFQDANATNTSATFFVAGDYVLRLTATDGALEVFDDVTATAQWPSPDQPMAVLVEAESGNISPPMIVGVDSQGGGGADVTSFITTPIAGEGTADCGVSISEAGNYVIWARVKTPDDAKAHFYISANGVTERPAQANAASVGVSGWRWACLYYRSGSGVEEAVGGPAQLVLPFDVGTQTITVRSGHANVQVDKLLVTNERNFVPADLVIPQIPAPAIAGLGVGAKGARLTWNAVPGAAYRLMYKDSLTDTQWLPASPDLVALEATLSWCDETAGASSRRFYTVAILP